MKNYMKHQVLCIGEEKQEKSMTFICSRYYSIPTFYRVYDDPFLDILVDPNYDILVEEEVHQHGDPFSPLNCEVNMSMLKSLKMHIIYKNWSKVVNMIKL